MSWEMTTLGEWAPFQYGKALKASDRDENGIFPVYGSNGVVGHHSEAYVQGPGIIIGRKGSVGVVNFCKDDFWPIDTTFYISDEPEKRNVFYTYYLLQTLGLEQMNSDAAVPGLNRNNAHALEISIPPLPTQNRIASILSAYDDLIEVNNRRIRLLEEAARQLYQEWFVRLHFPGHEQTPMQGDLPEGWERVKLKQEAELKYGKALKEVDRIPGDYLVYGSSGIVGTHNAYLTGESCIIVGRKGNVGSLFWSFEPCNPIDTVYYIDNSQADLFLFYSMKGLNFINNDGAVPGLNRDFAYSQTFLKPTEQLRKNFNQSAGQMYSQIKKLTLQNQKLRQARDLLLPRLMRGELLP